jgi:hypothetical protein
MQMIDLESRIPSFGRAFDKWNIQIKWNAHGQFWYMSIFTKSGDQLASGIKLVMGRNLLEGFGSTKSPRGEMFLIPKADRFFEPDYENLNSFGLYYNGK